MNAYQKLFQALLGRDKASSLVGLLYALAVIAWELHEDGYADWRMIAIAVGIGLLLRFLNESFPGIGEIAFKVAQQLMRLPHPPDQIIVRAAQEGRLRMPPSSDRPNQAEPLGHGVQVREGALYKQLLEEEKRRAIGLENENAALRAELALRDGQLKQGGNDAVEILPLSQ